MMTLTSLQQLARRPRARLLIATLLTLLCAGREAGRHPVEAQSSPSLIVKTENANVGDGDWDISGAGDPSIQGFASDISVNTGQTVDFKIKTDSNNYQILVYR